jgi:hypothetical protein
MGSGIIMMKQYSSCQLAWMFSGNCIPKPQQNFTVRCRIHIFTTLLKMSYEYSLRILKHGKHNIPSWWLTRNRRLFGRAWTGIFLFQLWTALRDKHLQLQTGNIYLWLSFALSFFCPRKTHNTTLLFSVTLLKHVAILTTETEHAHARLLHGLSWSWTVLLPSDTRRKTITYVTAILLPFVTYSLIFPCMINH